MIAEKNDGPFIPSMAAEAIIRHTLDGRRLCPARGPRRMSLSCPTMTRCLRDGKSMPASARPCRTVRRFIGACWARRGICCRSIAGDARPQGHAHGRGRAIVERGSNPVAQLIAGLFGFPDAGHDVPVTVAFRLQDGREIWRREFAGRVMQSTQEEGRGRFERLVCEHFGPFCFGLALVLDNGRLNLVVRALDRVSASRCRFLFRADRRGL